MEGFSLIGRDTESSEKRLIERQDRVKHFVESNEDRAKSYFVTPELEKAVDVALTLGRPLLLTGEPGSGKTLAAFWIASKFGLLDEHFHQFQVRSDSRAIDICYNFDAVSWFRESQLASAQVEKSEYIKPRELGLAFGWRNPEMKLPHVVLIDEIDKAPRDFPNDLLLELDQMKFKILETGEWIGPPALRPIIIITSNSERRLPDPFLRRCITHHIEITFETVKEILKARLAAYRQKVPGAANDEALILAGANFWSSLTGLEGRLSRKPTVAEFWQWLILANEYPDGDKIDLIAALNALRGPQIKTLPRIDALFGPSDLEIVSNA